ncbi:serine hydrolase domain-containing protein [Rhodoluna sp.]|uniref:serine hydrolase domain-containing protein n=1 Tax=Rhodoluna sp. TaxID=1969481 RepID=UPI0025E2D205|nr:serine hydrolase domain-containing protein [Rhodoluna sp.]
MFFAQAGKAPAGGSALAIYKDGLPVLDIWQGSASPGVAWNSRTMSVIFSNTKGLAAIVANQLIEMGFLDPDEKVAHYWPSFAQFGKAEIPVKWILQHKAGLSAVRRDLSFEELVDGSTVTEELAAQEPLWLPGAGHAYHALTFGHLVGKLVESVTGKTIGTYFQEQIAKPLGVAAYIGLPANEFKNLAPLVTDGRRHSQNPSKYSPQYWIEKSMTFGKALPIEIAGPGTGFNDPRLLASELAGAGCVTSASALAKIYSATVATTDGIRFLTDETIRSSIEPQTTGPSVWGEPGPWPVRGLGFMLNVPGYREMVGKTSFGHDGLGGQQGFADLDHRIGFAYTTSYLFSGESEQENQQELAATLRKVLG